AAGGLDVGEDAPSQRQQRLAGRGERDVASGAAEQGRAEFAFEPLDLLAQRGLGHPDPSRGAGEVAGLGDCDEVGELRQLHNDSLRLSRRAFSCLGRGRSALPTVNRMRSTIGLKAVMAVTGAVLLTFVVAHAVGDLKFFAGPKSFDGYAEWLRTIGSPVLGHGWYLWAQRAVLAFGFRLRHGVHAAVRSLGGPGARTLAAATAVGVTAAFLAVPLAVVTGVTS